MNLKHLLFYGFFIFALVAFGSIETAAQTKKLTISNLKGSDYLGCGCSLQTPAEAKNPRSTRFVFWSEDRKEATLNINGADTTFKLVKEGKRLPREKIGSRFSDEYRANGVTVKIDYVVTRVCLKGEEDCEATDYNAVITVSKGSQKTTVKTVGACGC